MMGRSRTGGRAGPPAAEHRPGGHHHRSHRHRRRLDRRRPAGRDPPRPRLSGPRRAHRAGVHRPPRPPPDRRRRAARPAGRHSAGHAPLVLVITRELVDPELTVPLLRLAPKGTKPGIVDRNHGEQGLAPYRPIPEVELPDPAAYLLLDVDRGEEFLDVRPEEALPVILGRGRTPLTIEEGIAVVTHAPSVLEKNCCFMLSGSRRGDRRVPAMWISERAPKLGWCWDGNPHTWLGVASTGGRTA